MSEPDLASTFGNKVAKTEGKQPLTYKKLRRRQIKELAKFHAKDIIAFKINKKLAEQAA